MSKEKFDLEKAKRENPYRKKIRGKWIDVYDIMTAFRVPYVIGHAVKKLLCLGARSGGKSPIQDLKEAIWTLERAVEIMEEELEEEESDEG